MPRTAKVFMTNRIQAVRPQRSTNSLRPTCSFVRRARASSCRLGLATGAGTWNPPRSRRRRSLARRA
jgi:hypothetical protein